MTTYELMEMVLIDKKGNYHFGKDVTALDRDRNPTNVDSNSCLVGKAKEIIKFLLKRELRDYKLVKRKLGSTKNTSK
ncbi:MAG: hypothetical protein KAW47_09860 [Thermoplasmatales archaeon]|nr:hypothetical protein [Thermoplasmatales archaeon]